MKGKPLSCLNSRWVILLDKCTADEFEETDFKVIARTPNMYSQEYELVLVEALVIDGDYTAEDVMISTGALAVHEEYTNAVITTLENVSDLNDIYPWSGGGNCLIGDMLTDVERMSLVMHHFYTKAKTRISIEDIDIKMDKDGKKIIPLSDNLEKMFTDDPYSIIYKDDEWVVWFASLVKEETGMFLVVVDDSIVDDDDEDSASARMLPAPYYKDWDDWYDDYPWGRAYDDYDYDDHYYCRT